MYEANVNGGNNQDQAATDPAQAAMPIKQGARAGRWPDSRRAILMGRVDRSQIPARRYWLQFLDAPFAKAFRGAGALDVGELAAEAPRILRCDESRVETATLEEWWEYAKRRGWLQPAGPLWQLSNKALADLREEHERINSPNPKHLASGLAHWVMPTSLVGFAGLASGRYLVLEAAILVMAGVIIVGLLFAAETSRATDPSTDRWFARCACDWLEGRPVPLGLGANRQSADFTRLYESAIREK